MNLIINHKSTVTTKDLLKRLFDQAQTALLFILIGLVFILILMKITDRVCDKPFSKEFKTTQTYRDMQCPI